MRVVKNREFEWNGSFVAYLRGILPTFDGNNSKKPRKPPFSERRLYSNGTKNHYE
jgi:hypothetical protein